MTTVASKIKSLNFSQELKNDTKKLVQVESSLDNLTKQCVNKDIDTINNEATKIKKFGEGVKSVLDKIDSFKAECLKTTNELQAEIKDLDRKIQIYQRDFKNNNKESQYQKQIVTNQTNYKHSWQKRIQIAQTVNPEILAKVDIDNRKSKAHEVFKWIIVTIYGQPEAKYYWPNFKQQIFERDQGSDFKERLGKVNASNAKEQQRVKTVQFLSSFKDVVGCEQLAKVGVQVQKIRQVAEIYLSCYELAMKTKQLEVSIEKSKEQSRERDEEAMRWKARSDALQDRLKSNKEYLGILGKVQQKLVGKNANYEQKEVMAKQVVQQLQKNDSLPVLVVPIESQTKELCSDCTIF